MERLHDRALPSDRVATGVLQGSPPPLAGEGRVGGETRQVKRSSKGLLPRLRGRQGGGRDTTGQNTPIRTFPARGEGERPTQPYCGARRKTMTALRESGWVVALDSNNDAAIPEIRIVPNRAASADLRVAVEEVGDHPQRAGGRLP